MKFILRKLHADSLEIYLEYNLGQKIVDKFTKLSKICFSMECLTADFSRFSYANVKTCLLRDRLGTHYQI